MPKITLKGHMCTGHGCFPPRPSNQGCTGFTINGVPVHLQTHSWSAHGCATCAPHPSVLANGISGFTINEREVGSVGDPVACGSSVAQGISGFTVER